MQKIIKFIASLLGIVFLLCIITVTLLLTLIHPNNFKNQISQQVFNYTGRHLTMQGDIHWSFIPSLGLRFENADLSNAVGFGNQPFARIHQATVAIKILPLFHHQIAINKLALNGLEIHLQKNANGLTNWQDLIAASTKAIPEKSTKGLTKPADDPPADPPGDVKTSTITTTDKQPINNSLTFHIATIDVVNSTITWTDQQKKQNITLQNIAIHGKDIAERQFFPFIFQTSIKSVQPDLNGTFTISGQMQVDLAKQNYQLQQLQINSQLKGSALPNNSLNITLQGDLMTNNSQHKSQGHLQTNHLQIGNFAADNVALQFVAQDNQITLDPIQAQLYQGKYTGKMHLNFTKAIPQFNSQAQLSNIQIEPLLHNLADVTHLHMTGVGDLTANLVSKGDSQTTIIQNLQGQGNFAVRNGSLEGINIPYWITTGLALLHRESLPTLPSENKTDFGQLTGNFTVKNGILQNNDFLLNSPQLTVKGAGTADLVKQQINYQLKAQLIDQTTKEPKGNIIPLEISGSLSHPVIRPSVASLLKSQLKDQYEKNKDKISEQLDKFLGKDVGSKVQNQLEHLFH